MSGWSHGSSTIDELIERGSVQRLTGVDAGVGGLMARARQLLQSSNALLNDDPATAYTLAYDAAKHAGMALLAVQNLRATGGQSHLTIEQVLAAQFAGTFDKFNRLRRRRNELDYPEPHEGFADTAEATVAHGNASQIVDDAQRLLDQGVLTTY